MSWIRVSAKILLLGSAIGIAAVAWAGSALPAVQPSSGASSPSTTVFRGSADPPAAPDSGNDPSPVVLRGSPPSPADPYAATYGCPAGYLYDPSYGCVVPGYGYDPYDYDYWPYYGSDWSYPGSSRRRFPHGFANRAGRVSAAHFRRPAVNGFGHGFAHIGGFGRR